MDGTAKAAADFYCSVFVDSKITDENPLAVIFELGGHQFMCLNGGPTFKPNPSISFFVEFDAYAEVERTYGKLIDGGSALMPLDAYPWSERYGWVQDKFGVNWQLFFGSKDEATQKFSPCLMFTGDNAGQAERAIEFYSDIFRDSSIISLSRYVAGEHDVEGTIKHGIFSLDGQVFRIMDSSMPHGFSFNEGISIVVSCKTQDEIDRFWTKLSDGGSEGQCGWLKDKYGISWQIVPEILPELMKDGQRSKRVVEAFMQMKKLDIKKILEA